MEFAPDLMKMLDGTPVTREEQWEARRKELIDILSREIYGYAPKCVPPAREKSWKWIKNAAPGMRKWKH